MYVYVVYVYIQIYIYICIYTYICIYVCVCANLLICLFTYIKMYYIYTHHIHVLICVCVEALGSLKKMMNLVVEGQESLPGHVLGHEAATGSRCRATVTERK